MSAVSPTGVPSSANSAAPPGSLRAALDARRAAGTRHSLADAVSLVAPLCRDAAAHHANGQKLFVHPSSISVGRSGATVDVGAAARPPIHPRDRACVAPEERDGTPGNARATVYSVGAIFYELLTGETVGAGMKRPSAIVPGLPPAVEVVLGKALVTDERQRPDDLRALAQAIEGLAADGNADGFDIDVDVSGSMLPPEPAGGGYGVGVTTVNAPKSNDPTQQLADLKARLESDPRPRYIVIEQGMDHGPFSAVELLQQLASNQFSETSILKDDLSKEERPLGEWESFAPFARQARLRREIVAEKKQIERVVSEEKKATTSKALIGGGVVGLLFIGLGVWFFATRASRTDNVRIGQDSAVNVETNGNVKSASSTGAVAGVGGRLPTSGNYPVLPGGMSCEAAQAKYVEEMKLGDKTPDLTAGQFGGVLNNGSYLNACGVPSDTHVNVCAAVQNGRAVGVTVTLNPPNPGQASCVAGRVRSLSFPSNPKLDIARTTF